MFLRDGVNKEVFSAESQRHAETLIKRSKIQLQQISNITNGECYMEMDEQKKVEGIIAFVVCYTYAKNDVIFVILKLVRVSIFTVLSWKNSIQSNGLKSGQRTLPVKTMKRNST